MSQSNAAATLNPAGTVAHLVARLLPPSLPTSAIIVVAAVIPALAVGRGLVLLFPMFPSAVATVVFLLIPPLVGGQGGLIVLVTVIASLALSSLCRLLVKCEWGAFSF